MHIRVDHAEPESEFQAEQMRRVFGGPQASSDSDANIIVIKISPGAFNHAHCLLIWILPYVSLWLCIKFIGVVWYHSYIKNDLPVYLC
jgi:hypothetical protein